MLFASFDFLLFFAVAFAGYWALVGRPRWRAAWVVVSSYFFYMAGSRPVDGPLPPPWYYVGLLVLSTAVDYVAALCIGVARQRAEAVASQPPAGVRAGAPGHAGRGWLLVSLVTNLGLLGYFKYTGFAVEALADVGALLGVELRLPAVELLLPVGISFYTFQSLSYTIDVYRGRMSPERSVLRFAFFVAFFPQLVAGPIVRARDFLPQLARRPGLTREDVDFAVWRIAKGLVKKVLFADFIAATFTDRVFASPIEHSSLENLLALYAFTLQIYADFSGYSDIAIGTARLLGFRIPENFNRPYQAVDVADFWRRWHITLSTWLRDYVYYPLGGGREGARRTYVNLWITMFLVGIWHGASWNFVIYANVQAFAMLYNRFCRRAGRGAWDLGQLAGISVVMGLLLAWLGAVLHLDTPWAFGAVGALAAFAIGRLPRADEAPILRPVHVLLTVHFSVLSRVFFRADGLDAARAMASKVVQWDGLGAREGLFALPGLSVWLEETPALVWARPLAEWGILLVMLAGFAVHYTPSARVEPAAQRWLGRVPSVVVGAGVAVVIGILGLLLAGPRANIYFAF
jgi:alginate O-acetyltransferase complex protein AlgI